MKKLINLLMLIVLLQACNPINKRGEFAGALIEINSSVLNPKATIALGDSITFHFEVPDTVVFNGTKVKVTATIKDEAAFGFSPNKITPTSVFGSTNDPSQVQCISSASVGKIVSFNTLYFENRNGKLMATLHFIPQQKGVYYFHQVQLGIVSLNNNTLKASFSFNFNNVNQNHQLLIDSAKAASGFASWIQDRVNRNLEIYGFEVK